MPTAPAVVRSRFKWHTRATWSAREDRIPSLVWLALIGSGKTGPPRHAGWLPGLAWTCRDSSTSLRRPLLWWMFMPSSSPCGLGLAAQVLLVVGDRVALHRRLGWFRPEPAGQSAGKRGSSCDGGEDHHPLVSSGISAECNAPEHKKDKR